MVIDRITGCSYPVLEEGESIEIGYNDLSYVVVQYVGFDFETHQGEIICNNAIAQDLVEIFYELYDVGVTAYTHIGDSDTAKHYFEKCKNKGSIEEPL